MQVLALSTELTSASGVCGGPCCPGAREEAVNSQLTRNQRLQQEHLGAEEACAEAWPTGRVTLLRAQTTLGSQLKTGRWHRRG